MLKFLLTACLIGIGFLGLGAMGGQRPSRCVRSRAGRHAERGNRATRTDAPAALANIGWIGVSLENAKGQEVRVKDVFPGGPAAFARVRAGDVLLKIADANVDSRDAAEAAIERLVPRRQTSLTIRRQGKAVELKITPDSLAEFREHYISEMMRRDPRDPKYGQHHGVSEADMSVELVRRLFEQHQRLETTLNALTREIQALRKEVRALQK